MTLELAQKESIEVLSRLEILPVDSKIKIKEFGNDKIICREYSVKVQDETYKDMDKVVIKYKVGKHSDKVKDYSVYLANEEDTVCLCKYSPRILNTLFNNILMLEMSNWRNVAKQRKPLKTINDYKSLMFELDIDNKRLNLLLERLIEKNSSLLNDFEKYQNSDEVIPFEIWKNSCSSPK